MQLCGWCGRIVFDADARGPVAELWRSVAWYGSVASWYPSCSDRCAFALADVLRPDVREVFARQATDAAVHAVNARARLAESWLTCEDCDGQGSVYLEKVDPDGTVTERHEESCGTCRGSGRVAVEVSRRVPVVPLVEVPRREERRDPRWPKLCATCGGTGKLPAFGGACPDCEGSGIETPDSAAGGVRGPW